MKTISVILPNYNYAHYFSSRLDEVLAQTYPVSEIIVLDDASTDESVSCIKTKLATLDNVRKVKIKTVFNSKNSGSVFSQWQKGIKLASSDYIWIAELDDSTDARFLETSIAPILQDPSIVLSYTASKLIGAVSVKDRLRQAYDLTRRRHFSSAYVVPGNVEVEKNLAVFNSIPNVSACIFKNIPELQKILNGAKDFKLSGDWYFYLNLLKLGSLAYSPKPLNLHRLSQTSVTSNTDLAIRFREIKNIHRLAETIYQLPPRTKQRMIKLERSLCHSWGLENT